MKGVLTYFILSLISLRGARKECVMILVLNLSYYLNGEGELTNILTEIVLLRTNNSTFSRFEHLGFNRDLFPHLRFRGLEIL